MKKLLKALLVLLLIVGAWLAIVHFSWLPGTTDEQRAALARMQAPTSALGRDNAFAAVWFSGYDVPDAELAPLMAEESAAWDRFRATPTPVSEFTSVAKGRFPEVARPPTADGWCGAWKPACLAEVRAHQAEVRPALEKLGPFSRNAARLARYDHFANAITMTFHAPLPQFSGLMQVELTAAALKAIDGDHAAALADTCAFAQKWRRLRANTDVLIADMVGVAYVTAAAQLAAEILAEAPSGLPWSDTCAVAFAPLVAAEFEQCPEWKSEFAIVARFIDDLSANPLIEDPRQEPATVGAKLLLNRKHVIAALAPRYERLCMASASVASSRAPTRVEPNANCGAFEYAFDPVGCIFVRQVVPDFTPYIHRVLDLDGRLAMLRTAEWLRTQPGGADAAFAARPASLRTAHDVEIDTAAHTLTMTAFDASNAERRTWTIPYMPSPAP